MLQRVAVLTSGGDAPGMNAAIRAVTRSALDAGIEVFGVHHGFQGLTDDVIEPLRARDVGGIIQRGGTVLGSARCKEFREESGRVKALRNLSRRGIEALVVIGGNGSQSGGAALSAMDFPVVGVASTIDNDLVGSDMTIGVDTAVNVTLEAIDRLRTTGSSHQRAFLVETMGRDCGYLALFAGLAGGAEVICIPEQEVTPHEVAERLNAAYQRGKTHAIVVVAEGAKHGSEALMAHFKEHKDQIGFELRATQLGHVVRGAQPTAADRMLATRLGVGAIDALKRGEKGVLVGMVEGALTSTALREIAGKTKSVDLELIQLARMLAK
jgi:6-phosphofructokinase 1